MKKIFIYAAAALCSLAMTTSCTKENLFGPYNNSLEIFAEHSGTKTTVNGTTVKWVEDDVLWINGVEGTVTHRDGRWFVEGNFTTDNSFNLFYPVTLATATGASNLNETTATVVFPSRYVSSFDGDNQEISLPMGARSAEGATGVELKHLSAGLNLVVTNSTGNILMVDSVSVTSANVNICGQAVVDLSGSVPTVAAGTDGANTVTVCFSTPVSIAVDGVKTIQVPVIPNTNSLGDLTIKIYSHNTLESLSIQFLTFAKTKNNAPALGRNSVAALPIEMTSSGTEITRHILGAFSVSATKKVYFSMGNLQYKDDEPYPWRFATNQFDLKGEWNAAGWVDLFGWGTWTGDNPNPLDTIKQDTHYEWNVSDFTQESNLADASVRGYDWRTLSAAEWKYLANTRLGNRYVKAIVHGNKGTILFPDGFTKPASVNITSTNISGSNFSVNTIDDDTWALLETEGCVFLPAAGCREGGKIQEVNVMGGYHSSTPTKNSSINVDKMRFDNTTLNPNKFGGRRWGNSVRLVRNAN